MSKQNIAVNSTRRCVEVPRWDDGVRPYMVADASIVCFEGEWLAWAALSVLGIAVYVIGVPLTFLAVLFSAQR